MPHGSRALTLLPAGAAAIALLVSYAASGGGRGAVTARAQDEARDGLVAVELSTVGFDRRAGAPIVLLREPESGHVVPIWVGSAEAQAIALALHGIAVPRPMTHDLMANLLAELNADVEEVLVHDLREHTYFGTVRLRVAGEERLRDVDSRPSDALALALRTGARIRVAHKILVAAPEFDFIAPEGPEQIVQVLGVTVVSATPALRERFGLPDRQGVVVTSVSGRARDEGLRRGDLIVEVNDEPLQQPMEFFERIQAMPPGDLVRITFWRDEEEHRIELPADLPPDRPRRDRLVAEAQTSAGAEAPAYNPPANVT